MQINKLIAIRCVLKRPKEGSNILRFQYTRVYEQRNSIKGAVSMCLLFIILFCNATHAQTYLDEVPQDQITTESHIKDDVVKIYEESLSLKEEDWRKSIELSQKALEISETLGLDDIAADALYNIGALTYYNIDRDAALSIYKEGYQYALKNYDNMRQYNFALKIAEWYLFRSQDYERSHEYFEKAIEAGKRKEAYYEVGRAYARLALIPVQNHDFAKIDSLIELSTEYYFKADDPHAAAYYNCDIGSKLWDFDMNKAADFYLKALELDDTHYYVNLCIGKAYISLGLPENALPHLTVALDSLEVKEWRYGVCMNELAAANVQLKNYELADSLCNFNIETYTKDGSRTQNCLSKSFLIKGQIQEIQNNDKLALELYETSQSKAKSSLDRTNSVLALGEYYLQIDSIGLSKTYCRTAYKAAKKSNRKKIQSRACDCLYKVSKARQDFSKSLDYLEEKDRLDQSLNASTASKKLEVFAKLSLREKETAYKEQLKDEQFKSQSSTNIMLRIALASGLIFILILFRMLCKIKKQNQEINSQSDILKTTNDNLIQSNDQLERFAYIISHDLKTPLLIITQFTRLLSDKLGNSEKPLVNECVQHIEKGGTRMMHLIEDVLEFTTNPDLELTNEEINLGSLVYEISELLLSNLNNAQIDYKSASLPTIRWNYSQILLLLKNLIENGLKYNDSETPRINIYSKQDDTMVTLYIEDNGIGIEEEYFNKIFVMFKRLHNHQSYSGSGLGLATCKKIVKEFGGEISIESEVNKGSVFMIHFPIAMIVEEQEHDSPDLYEKQMQVGDF